MAHAMTIAEKILARASGREFVRSGEYVTARIDAAMMPDAFRLIRKVLKQAGIAEQDFRIWNPDRFFVVSDHRSPAADLAQAELNKDVRELAQSLGVKHFYGVFPGISHQVMMEEGNVAPGELVVGADSHTVTYGALNVASTGIGASEMAYVMATGELWFRVPETIRFEITGKLNKHVYSKDVLLYIAGRWSTDVAQYKAVEWCGEVVKAMSLDARMTIANMSVEIGAKFGLFEADEKTLDFARPRVRDRAFTPVFADPDAQLEAWHKIDGRSIVPQVALPHSVGNVVSVDQAAGKPIQQAVIATCCNGRIEDLQIAAEILKGRKVAPGVRLYIAPASWKLYKSAMVQGLLAQLLDAGAMIGNPACGFCTGYQGVLAKGESCIAATPRNFRGRMGSNEALIYLASPATVAASAVTGKITDPRGFE
jgi:3-isopropylmalate/(R)-2-methylmalate dehydratase large subunit